jgi:DNA-directed RNA polymerase specialized sigma24 family protein
LDLATCSRVACTLVLNTERVVRSMRVLELQKDAALVGADDESENAIADPVADRARGLVELRAWLWKAVPRDVDLVCAVVVDGRDCREVANALGLSHAAIRQRLGRALEKIRRTIDESAVTDLGVSPALAGHETRQPVQAMSRV